MVKIKNLFIILLSLLLLLSVNKRAESEIMHLLSTFGGSYNNVKVENSRIYITTENGIIALDASSPADPVLLSFYNGTDLDTFCISNEIAYVAQDEGFDIIDYSNPYSPHKVGSFSTGNSVREISVSNNLAYIADYGGGFKIVDVSTPSSPQLLGKVFVGSFDIDLSISDNNVFTVSGTSGAVKLIDVSDPANPHLKSIYYIPNGYAQKITSKGSTAYVIDGTKKEGNKFAGFNVIDFSNPLLPKITKSAKSYANKDGNILATDSKLFLTSGRTGILKFFDIKNDPLNPVIQSSSYGTGPNSVISAFDVEGTKVYIADERNGLHIINVNDNFETELLGRYKTVSGVKGVYIVNDKAFLADYYEGLVIIDISNTDLPKWESSYSSAEDGKPINCQKVVVDNGTAYLATANKGVIILDVSDTANPTFLGSYDNIDNVVDLYLSGSYLYLASPKEGLQIIDVSSPTSPSLVGSYKPDSINVNEAKGIYLSGTTAYLSQGYSGVKIIDVSNIQSPRLIGEFTVENAIYALSVKQLNDILYVASGRYLYTVDVSNPSSPTLLHSFTKTNFGANRIALSGNQMYVGGYYDELFVFDISDYTNPQYKGAFKLRTVPPNKYPHGINDIFIDNTMLYLAGGEGGLKIIEGTELPELSHYPSITSISPDTGFFGDKVTLSGNYFGDEKVKVKATDGNLEFDCSIESWQNDEITFSLPWGFKEGPIQFIVENSDGLQTTSENFTYEVNKPVINSVFPKKVNKKESFTVEGENFGPNKYSAEMLVKGGVLSIEKWGNDAIIIKVNKAKKKKVKFRIITPYGKTKWQKIKVRKHF